MTLTKVLQGISIFIERCETLNISRNRSFTPRRPNEIPKNLPCVRLGVLREWTDVFPFIIIIIISYKVIISILRPWFTKLFAYNHPF